MEGWIHFLRIPLDGWTLSDLNSIPLLVHYSNASLLPLIYFSSSISVLWSALGGRDSRC